MPGANEAETPAASKVTTVVLLAAVYAAEATVAVVIDTPRLLNNVTTLVAVYKSVTSPNTVTVPFAPVTTEFAEIRPVKLVRATVLTVP